MTDVAELFDLKKSIDYQGFQLSNIAPPKPKRGRRIALYAQLIVLDAFAIVTAFLIAGMIQPDPGVWEGMRLAVFAVPVYIAFALQGNTYSSTVLSFKANAFKAGTAIFYTLATGTSLLFLVQAGAEISRFAGITGFALSFLFLIAGRRLYCPFASKALGGSIVNELLIIDSMKMPRKPDCHFVYAKDIGLQPDLSDPVMLDRMGWTVLGFEKVIIACPPDQRRAWTLMLRGANVEGEIIAPEFDATDVLGISSFGQFSTFIASRGPLSTTNRARKRLLDLGVTVPLIILLAPLFALIAVLIKLDSKGPVLFKQVRVGRGNRHFRILKFRSMRTESGDAAGNRSASRDDDRITAVGRFIRKTSIDELPQLFNVLLGDMSLIGPRPHALGSLAGEHLFWEIDHRYWMRHSLKPGITGLAQVRGYRGATERRDDLINRLGADLEYIENWSMLKEIVILLKTVKVVVHRNAF
jgi:polysaccharide biosynthesis protein PslA